MELISEIRKQIIRHTTTIDGYKAQQYQCPSGHYMMLEWKDENGDVWSSGPFPDFKVYRDTNWKEKEEQAMIHFLKYIYENKN